MAFDNRPQPADDVLRRHLLAERRLAAGGPLVGGNRLLLLKDGPETYAAMRAAIQGATDHINLESYCVEDDEVGRAFAELLLEKCAAGVEVNVIYDSVGAFLTPSTFFDRLRDAGARVIEFNPVNPLAVGKRDWLLNHRDHRKLLIVDGAIAFVGGINISEVYSSGSFTRRRRRPKPTRTRPSARPSGWRDTHLEIAGPAVAEFQRLFHDTWRRQDGPPLASAHHFPDLEPAGAGIVRAIGSRAGDDSVCEIYETLLDTMREATRRIYLTIAYFAPDLPLLDALKNAAARGVDVRIIMPATSDWWPVFHVGRSYYHTLLKAGVRVFERRGSVMHAKTAVIDGVWSTVGSTNLDWRSLYYNDELNAVVLGEDFAAHMERMFADDQAHSDEITLRQWRRRPLPVRALEWSARLIERVL